MSAMNKGGKRIKTGPWPRLQKFWDIRAACNFIGGGTGSGLLLIAAIFLILGQPVLAPIVVGVVFISFGLFMVFLEIGKPWRSINMFFHPQTSWMTREGIVVGPLFLCAALIFFYTSEPFSEIAAYFMGICAVTFLYCQLRILHAAKGIPSWCTPALKPYIFTTGLTEALGIAVCIPGLMEEKSLWIALGLMLVVRKIVWQLYAKRLHKDKAPKTSRKIIDGIYVKVLTGHLLSITLLISANMTNALVLVVFAGLIAAGTGWYTKIIIITKAAQTRGFGIPRTPVRGKGQSRVLSS